MNAVQREPLLPLVVGQTPPSLRRILSQEGVPWRDYARGQAQGRFLLFDSALDARQKLAAGQVAIDLADLRAELGHDALAELDDVSSRRALWHIGGFAVQEEVARIDKRQLRQRVIAALRRRVEHAGGLWLRVAHAPFPYRGAFCFRLDHDDYQPHDFQAVLDATKGAEEAFTHFVCGATHERWPAALAELRGLDVGSHGYWHHTYADPRENRCNIARGIDCLRSAGIEPSGYAAPHGRYSPALVETLAALGVTHSSEFALAYDDLPFFPHDGRVLQIPIHPLCLGIFLEAARSQSDDCDVSCDRAVQATIDHFCRAADDKYHACEPILLYGHPDARLGRYPQVIRRVLEQIDQFGAVWKTNMTRLNAWWRARAAVQLRVYAADGHYVVLADDLPRDYRVAVEYLRGDLAAPMELVSPILRFAPSLLAYQNRKPRARHDLVRIDRPHSLRAHMLRWIDWETVTPLAEIPTASFRGWVKHKLRELRDDRRDAPREGASP